MVFKADICAATAEKLIFSSSSSSSSWLLLLFHFAFNSNYMQFYCICTIVVLDEWGAIRAIFFCVFRFIVSGFYLYGEKNHFHYHLNSHVCVYTMGRICNFHLAKKYLEVPWLVFVCVHEIRLRKLRNKIY